jgi:thioesterase domain-containing protein
MDTPCGDQMPAREDHAAVVAALLRDHSCELDVEELRRLERADRLPFALETLRRQGSGDEVDGARLERHAAVMEHNVAALYRYRPEPYPGRLLFFRAAERRPGDPPRPELPWIELARGGTEVVIAPGNHISMHQPPHLEVMAERLEEALALARDGWRS